MILVGFFFFFFFFSETIFFVAVCLMHISLNVFIGTEERNSAVFTEDEFKRREATVNKEDVGFAALAGLLRQNLRPFLSVWFTD